MTEQISLCAVPYLVTEQDGQIIFDQNVGFFGCHTQFTFEWKGSGWYMVNFDDSFERIFVPHIVRALQWVEENYEIAWTNGTGVAHRKAIA